MKKIIQNIPNLITLTNLTCGLFAIIFTFEGDLKIASYFIFGGAFFDFIDGFSARLLKVSGEFGKQLDSMADIVTFGIAPGFILYQHIKSCRIEIDISILPLELFALLIPMLSACRLAKFNIDTTQTNSFIGLPTPALAIFIAALPLISFKVFPFFFNINFLTSVAIFMPILLLLQIPLFSLKITKNKDIYSQLNIIRIIFILSAIILFFVFKFAAIPFIVILYLILSLLNNKI